MNISNEEYRRIVEAVMPPSNTTLTPPVTIVCRLGFGARGFDRGTGRQVGAEDRDKLGPIEYALQFDFTHKVLLLTFGKTVTRATLLTAYDAAENFVADEGPCCGIIDFSAVENAEISAESVRSISKRPPAFPPGTKRIFVAPRPLAYGLSRMYQMLRKDLEGDLDVVHTLEEAYALLGLESATFRPIIINS